jgi:hypothetical protein
MIKLKTGYDDYSADDLAHLGETVAGNLPGLVIFATLKPTAPSIQAAADALRAAIAMVGPGRAEAIESAFAALEGLLGDVAVNAPQIPGVTDTDLAEIGLPKVKPAVRETTVPAAPTGLEPRHGEMPGEVRGRCVPPGNNLRGYVSQYSLDPNAGPWVDGGRAANSRAFHWTGLERGKDTWFRVAAINTIGQGPWSDPATIMVT